MEKAKGFVENTGCLHTQPGRRASELSAHGRKKAQAMWASDRLLPCLINDLAKSSMGRAIQKAWRWYRYEIAESGGPTGSAPSAAETCEQRKAMLELHSNSKWIHRVHLTLLRKHFTVRARVDLGLCSFYLEW